MMRAAVRARRARTGGHATIWAQLRTRNFKGLLGLATKLEPHNTRSWTHEMPTGSEAIPAHAGPAARTSEHRTRCVPLAGAEMK